MAIRSKPLKIALIVTAALFAILALVSLVSVLFFDRIFVTILYKKLALVPGSAVYEGWLKPSVPVYFSVYLFNVTNAAEVMQGAAPRLQEVGPYVYLENRERYDVELSEENPPKTIRFKSRIFYHFVPEMSVASPTIGKITIPNLIFAGLVAKQSFFYAFQTPFTTLSPHEAMWDFSLTFIPVNAGLFGTKNGTESREYVVRTGADDISKVGKILEVDGLTKLNVWDYEEANMINGSDGACAPPGMKVGSTVNFYVADICRSVVSYAVAKTHAMNHKDIELLVFSGVPPDPRDPATEWRERMFCKSEFGCPPKGLLSLQPCMVDKGVVLPLFLSQPYFLGADPRIPEAFDHFPDPIPEKHSTWVHIEPNTGFVLEAYKRIQFNLVMQNSESSYGKMAGPYYFPIGWVEERAVADKATLDMLYDQLFVPRKTIPFILSIVGAVFTVISILLIAILITCTRRRFGLARGKKHGAAKAAKHTDGKLGSNDPIRIIQPNQASVPQQASAPGTNTQVPEAESLLNVTEAVEINHA